MHFEKTDPITTAAIFEEFDEWLIRKITKEREFLRFFDCADSWHIAYAKLNNYTVVTLERSSDSKAKIKISNVSKTFNVI